MSTKLDFKYLDICIVDDETFIQRLIKSILSSLGVKHIRIASSGAEGYALLESKPADLIIIDWTMTPMTGVDLVKKIRTAKNEILADTPIIMLTAHSERDYVEQAVKAGATDYLVKPVSPMLLQQRIEGIFKTRIPISYKLLKLGAQRSTPTIKTENNSTEIPPRQTNQDDEEDDFLEFSIEEDDEEKISSLSTSSTG